MTIIGSFALHASNGSKDNGTNLSNWSNGSNGTNMSNESNGTNITYNLTFAQNMSNGPVVTVKGVFGNDETNVSVNGNVTFNDSSHF